MPRENFGCLLKCLASTHPSSLRAETALYRIQGSKRIDKRHMPGTLGSNQLCFQFLLAGGAGGQQTHNLSAGLCQTKKAANKKLVFCLSSEVGHRAEQDVRLDLFASAGLAYPIRCPNCPVKQAMGRSLAAVRMRLFRRVQLKQQKIVLQANVFAVKM